MANKVKFGLSEVHYAKFTGYNATTGEPEFATPVAIPGAVNLTLDAEGEESPFYADNIKYYKEYANNGYSGELEIALLPESFRTDILGEIKENGVLVEKNDAVTSQFALGFKVNGDTKETLYWYLNNSVSRPSTEAATTEDTNDPKTDKLSITASALTNNRVRTMTADDASAAVRAAWFTAVVVKGPSGGVKEKAEKKA